jgi:hypothetical protein
VIFSILICFGNPDTPCNSSQIPRQHDGRITTWPAPPGDEAEFNLVICNRCS